MVKSRRDRSAGHGRHEKKKDEFEQVLIEVARVTRVMKGGKRMSFRACLVIGDKNGRVGMGLRKGADVSLAINKAVTAAKKNLIKVRMINDTIPCKIIEKHGASMVLLKPAPRGTGVMAGGAVRAVLELAGIKNVVSKMLGSKSKINNVRATLAGLARLRDLKQVRELRS